MLTLHLKQFSFHPEQGPRKLARHVRWLIDLAAEVDVEVDVGVIVEVNVEVKLKLMSKASGI